MTDAEILAKCAEVQSRMEACAFAFGYAKQGAVKVRTFPRHNRLPHQSANKYVWYINGKRARRLDALKKLID